MRHTLIILNAGYMPIYIATHKKQTTNSWWKSELIISRGGAAKRLRCSGKYNTVLLKI